MSASTRGATRELGEPGHAYNEPHTVWFKLTLPTGTAVTLNACNGSYPGLTVYTGSRMSTVKRVAAGDCSVSFTALAGTKYRVVAEDGGSGGSFRISF